MSTYAPTLRGDALLLSGGHRGAPVLASLLHETGFLGDIVGGRAARGADRRLRTVREGLPQAAGALLDALTEARKRAERVGS